MEKGASGAATGGTDPYTVIGVMLRPHRDDLGETRYRQFGLSISLNADEHEGGDIRFPEFGSATYRPPTGGALVFSGSLLHEVTTVTKGCRYVFHRFFTTMEDAHGTVTSLTPLHPPGGMGETVNSPISAASARSR